MSLSVTVSGTTSRHVMTVTADDDAVLSAISDHRLIALLNTCQAKEQAIEKAQLLEIVSSVLKEVQSQWELLPYRYSTEMKMCGRDDMVFRGTGGMGFIQGGKSYRIKSGSGYCYLEDRANGLGAHKIDVRDRKTIETDGWGPIKITRRKLRVSVLEQLQGLRDFLSQCTDEQLKLIGARGPMTVKKLVRLAADGDEGAEEELFNRGGDAKRELLELAANPKVKSNRETIAFLLLTLFPSRESYAAVASMAERESDSERKNALLIMLHAMKSK